MKDLAGPDRGPGTPVRRTAATRSVRASVVARTGNAARLGPKIAAQLQTQIGNRAVARLVAQRSADVVGETETEAPPVNRTDVPVQRLRPGPEADPKFRSLTRDVRAKQKRLAAHPPAKAEAARAQGAAKAPPDDKQAHGKAAQAEKMNAAKPGDFDKAGFIAAVNAAIAKKAPQNLSEARDFAGSGKADAIKGEVAGKVSAGKKASASAIETTTKAAPDTSQVKDKTVTELVADRPPPTPGTPNPARAVPDKAPPQDTDFSAGPKQVDGAMAEAEVTEEQLARSNEPEFTGALQDKKSGEAHSATAPGQLRASEAQTLSTAKAGAAASGATSMASMALGRRTAGAALAGGKQAAKTTDEGRRAKVAAALQKVFDATKTEVETILTGIDAKVTTAFDTGEKLARDAFTSEHQQKMEDYKDRRYSGIRGKARWVRDKFAGLPAEANQIFVTARQGYVEKMKQVISSVADLIAAELGRAKARIAQGREELQTEVRALPKDLQAIGKQAAGEFSEKFDQLTESVDSKGSELVETLASRYTDALGRVDEEIDAEKDKNKGLIDKAIDAVAGVIKTILQLKDLLLGVLAKAAQAVGAIISDPIGFLGNLVSAVGAGLSAFMSRIGEHLQKGLVGWLLGSASAMGIQLPEKFDLRGILMMIASMLGLTWDAIKTRVIGRGVPAQAIEAAEGSMPLIAKLRSEGIGAAWEDIKERVGDLKAGLFAKITEYLVPTVLTAGITWIISLLNPASAFIKACKMIIDIVTFIVTRGAQIIEFVNSVLDAVIAIAAGGAGGVPALVENALAKSIPVLIGALAAILGVGGIADKVKSIIQSLAKPVTKAVDWITDKIVGVGKKVWGKIKTAGRKIKDKAKAGVARARARVAGAADPRTVRQKGLDLAEGLAAANRLAAAGKLPEEIRPKLPQIKAQYGMVSLVLVVETVHDSEATIHFEGEVNPRDRTPGRDVQNEKTYELTFTRESRSEFRLVENPKDRFPRAQQQLIDRAQQTVWENNKPSGGLGDKSTQFAAIAESIAGRALTTTGGRPAMHIGKNVQYGVGLDRYLADALLPEHAKEIIRVERAKCDSAKTFVEQYAAGKNPALPAWAAVYKDELVREGLAPDYPTEQPERKGKRRR